MKTNRSASEDDVKEFTISVMFKNGIERIDGSVLCDRIGSEIRIKTPEDFQQDS
jgi:hypothetical protein